MRERRCVKFRVDMLSDTKSKIIDMKPERDMIHYVWMALVLLAGKVNMAGELHMSRNLPYTIETLAIEFNRDKEISVKNIEVTKKAVIDNEECDREDKNDVAKNTKSPIINEDKSELEINNNETNKENHLSREISHNISHDKIPISFEIKKNKKATKKRKKEEAINVTYEEESKDEEMISFREGEFIQGDDEKIILAWTF